MDNLNCSACEDIRTNSSDFALNGVTDTVCASLKNNTGFNPSSGHDDCEDLDLANDCLIGNMADEIEAYDVCDWKDYMRKFVPNVWNMLKAIICTLCGIWSQIASILSRLAGYDAKIDCLSDTITGFDARYTASETEDLSLFYNWEVTNTASNPASPVSIFYGGMHHYVLMAPSTASGVADILNQGITTGDGFIGQYPNQTVGGITYSGVPVYSFTVDYDACDVEAIYTSSHVDSFGRFSYVIQDTARNGNKITWTVSIRAKLMPGVIGRGSEVSFAWNELARRRLSSC